MKIDFNIWWHRIIIVFIIGVIISVTMFFINEKPFSKDKSQGVQTEEDDHPHSEEAEPHGH